MTRMKYSGRIAPNCPYHAPSMLTQGHIVAPTTITPPNPEWGPVAQYGPTVFGRSTAYDPAHNCEGNFMSYKNQPNNNCYAYGTNIASNSFPQPGRASEGSTPWSTAMTADSVTRNAELDGLVVLPHQTLDALLDDPTYRQGVDGHFVALVFSPPESGFQGDPGAQWGGDYHWVRADEVDYARRVIHWSQKDGGDQVTNFDFAGQPITDPTHACWTVNLGPVSGVDPSRPDDQHDVIVTYEFHTFMWVPANGVTIL